MKAKSKFNKDITGKDNYDLNKDEPMINIEDLFQ